MHYEEEALPDSSTTTEKSKKEIELISKPQEWGGWLGALCLIFVLPIAIILPQIACSNNHCYISRLARITKGVKWESYLNLNAILSYTGFLIALGIASIIPIGRLVNGQQTKIGRLQYRINGLITALFMVTLIGYGEYKGYKIHDFVLNSCLQLSIAGWILGTLLAAGLYLKAGRMPVSTLNLYGSTNNIVYDFWQGREVNPRVGPLDFKFLVFRAGMIGTVR